MEATDPTQLRLLTY